MFYITFQSNCISAARKPIGVTMVTFAMATGVAAEAFYTAGVTKN